MYWKQAYMLQNVAVTRGCWRRMPASLVVGNARVFRPGKRSTYQWKRRRSQNFPALPPEGYLTDRANELSYVSSISIFAPVIFSSTRASVLSTFWGPSSGIKPSEEYIERFARSEA